MHTPMQPRPPSRCDHHPRKFPHPASQAISTPLPQSQPLFGFVSTMDQFCLCWNSYRWNHTVCTLLSKASFLLTWHSVLTLILGVTVAASFLLLSCSVVWISTIYFPTRLSIDPGLFLVFGYGKWSGPESSCSHRFSCLIDIISLTCFTSVRSRIAGL